MPKLPQTEQVSHISINMIRRVATTLRPILYTE